MMDNVHRSFMTESDKLYLFSNPIVHKTDDIVKERYVQFLIEV